MFDRILVKAYRPGGLFGGKFLIINSVSLTNIGLSTFSILLCVSYVSCSFQGI